MRASDISRRSARAPRARGAHRQADVDKPGHVQVELGRGALDAATEVVGVAGLGHGVHGGALPAFENALVVVEVLRAGPQRSGHGPTPAEAHAVNVAGAR